MWVVNGREQKAKGSLELLDDGFGKDQELDVWVLVIQIFCKLSNALSVGFGLKFEALALK